MLTRATLAFFLCLFTGLSAAHAKPAPSGSRVSSENSGAVRAKVRTSRSSSRAVPDLMISAAFVSQADLRYSPTSLGLALQARKATPYGFHLAGGMDLAFRANNTLLAPHAGAEWDVWSKQGFHLLLGGGLALPLQMMNGTTAAALALRGSAGTRWHWRWSEWALPRAELVFVTGPMLAPGNADGLYGAVQVVIGADYTL